MGTRKTHTARLAVSAGLVAALAGGVSLAPAVAFAVDELAQEKAVDQGATVESKAVTMVQGGGAAVQYDSIAAAIADAKPYDYKTNKEAYVITLNDNHAEDVSIPANTRIVIDLNGHTLSNASGHTITNSSNKLEVKDSVGTGVVDNTSNGKAALYNDVKATATLNGGSFTRSAEASTSDSDAGGNSYYVLKNYGTMIINKGVVVKFSDTNPGFYSSLVANGWQDAIKAEASTNGEPKPTDGAKKATLTINDGSFTGGQITVKNDDYGTLTIKGGAIAQPSEGRFAVYNNHIAKISGGNISSRSSAVASRMIKDTGANEGSLTVESAAVIVSEAGNPVFLRDGAKATITGGSFEAKGGAVAIGINDDASNAVVSGGTYKGTTKVSNRGDVLVDRYGVVEKDGSLVVEMTRPAATVIMEDGTATPYETFTKACSNAPAYSTVKLNENAVLGKFAAKVQAFGVTVDLNGFNIDGSAYMGPDATLAMKPSYGAKPVEGKDSTLRITNSVPQSGGTIKGKLPVEGASGNSMFAAPLYIGDEVTLEVLEGGSTAVKLGSSSYLAYSEKAASYVANGGFRMQAAGGSDRIYGSPSSAAADLPEGSAITMLHPYVGNEAICSGSKGYILDLGGNAYSYTGTQQTVDINYDGASITIRNGMLKAQNPLDTAGVSMLYSNSSLTMDGVTMQLNGATWGIGTNGGEENNTIRLVNSTIDVADGLGIYFPCSGSVVIDNTVIKAKSFGVQLCAGSLTVLGDKTSITASGSPAEKTEADGPIVDGAAISVIERDGYKDLGKVTISGGAFMAGEGIPAIEAYAFNNTDKRSEWTQAGDVVDISGGTYSAAPTNMDKLLAGGYELVELDGSWAVRLKENLRAAEVGGAYYPTVADAVAAARDGQTVKLLKGVEEDAEIRIDGKRSITLDLAGCKLDARAHQIVVESGSGLTVKGGGELTNTCTQNATGSYVVYGADGSRVAFDGVTVNGAYGLYAAGEASVKRANLNVTGGCAIAVNGSARVEIGDPAATAEENARDVVVTSANNCISTQTKEGAADSQCTVYGGTFIAGKKPDNPSNPWNSGPVYWASHGTLDIRGGVFKADVETAAVFQKNGTVKISGGEFTAKDGFKIDATAQDTTEIATEISGGKFAGTRAGFYSNADGGSIDYGASYSVKVTGGEFRGGSEGAIYVKEGDAIAAEGKRALEVTGGDFSENPIEFVPASGYEVVESNGMFTVSKYVPPTPPSGGGSTSDKTEVEKNPDGSTTTTVTKPDGSQTITHETASGTESVVKKDEDGNVTSTEVTVSKADAENGKVELPIEESEPGSDVEKAPEVEVKVPSSVSDKTPVQVTVPVAKGEGDEPDYGIVVFAVDADGNETVIPKCSVDKDGNVVFEATGDVTIKVVDNAKDMPDVTDADWFAGDVVDFATARGIVNGVERPDGSRVFDGYGKTSRGMFVAMLHNLELNPEAASEGSLADVPEGAFYADAAAWALGEGILSGVDMPDGSKQFQGGEDVTREQVAVFLMRYAEHLGMDVSKRAEIDFPDASEVSSYAKDAMSWAVAEGLFTGDDVTGELNPTDGAARAEVATVLMRFINLMYA